MTTYFKAVRPDGGSFHDPNFKWSLEPGGTTVHPAPHRDDASGYLSVATLATACTGMQWPCRLLEVEPVGETWVPEPDGLPYKVAGHGWRKVGERPAHEVFGPYGKQVVAIIDRCKTMTEAEAEAMRAAWNAERYTTWNVALDAAGDAAWDVVWDAERYTATDVAWAALDAAWDAERYTTLAYLAKDLITDEHFRLLVAPWESVMGKVEA